MTPYTFLRNGLVALAMLWCTAAPAQTSKVLFCLTPRQIVRMDEDAWIVYYTAYTHNHGAQNVRRGLGVYSEALDECNAADLAHLSRHGKEQVQRLLEELFDLGQLELRGRDLRGPHGASVAMGHRELNSRRMRDLILQMQGDKSGAKRLAAQALALSRRTAPSTWTNADQAQIAGSIRSQIAAWPVRSRIVVLRYLSAEHDDTK